MKMLKLKHSPRVHRTQKSHLNKINDRKRQRNDRNKTETEVLQQQNLPKLLKNFPIKNASSKKFA